MITYTYETKEILDYQINKVIDNQEDYILSHTIDFCYLTERIALKKVFSGLNVAIVSEDRWKNDSYRRAILGNEIAKNWVVGEEKLNKISFLTGDIYINPLFPEYFFRGRNIDMAIILITECQYQQHFAIKYRTFLNGINRCQKLWIIDKEIRANTIQKRDKFFYDIGKDFFKWQDRHTK
jgi:hypothetical protein